MRDNHLSPLTLTEAMSNFRPINRDTGFLLPPSVDEWLPQRHLARFVVEVIDGLELSELVMGYRQSLLRGLQNVKGEWNLVTMS
jgi:hypothetical protein